MERHATLTITEPGGNLLYWSPVAPGLSLREAITWAIHHGGLRDVYLRRYELLPGLMAIGLRESIGGARGHMTMALLRFNGHCRLEEDRATMRHFNANLSGTHS